MDSLKYMLRMFLWSLGISIGMKVVFGMYSVFGAIVLLIPFTVGIIAAFFLTRTGNTATVLLSSVHILLISGFCALADKAGILSDLSADSVSFFLKTAKKTVAGTDVFWSIMFVLGTYYITFITVSLIISSVRTKNASNYDDEYYFEEDDDYDSDSEKQKYSPSHKKKK